MVSNEDISGCPMVLIKLCFFWRYHSLFSFFFSHIFSIFYDHLHVQSDTIHSPTPGTPLDLRPWLYVGVQNSFLLGLLEQIFTVVCSEKDVEWKRRERKKEWKIERMKKRKKSKKERKKEQKQEKKKEWKNEIKKEKQKERIK